MERTLRWEDYSVRLWYDQVRRLTQDFVRKCCRRRLFHIEPCDGTVVDEDEERLLEGLGKSG